MWFKIGALMALFAMAVTADDCPVDREKKCVDDFRVALPYCKKAEEGKGRDIDADINCLKYFHTMETECWPCICYIAHKQNIKVAGC